MKTKKYKHLSFEDRCVIEEFLNNNYNFTKIGNRMVRIELPLLMKLKNIDFLDPQLIVIINLVVLNLSLLMFVMVVLNLTLVVKSDIPILTMLPITNIILL